MPDTSDEFKVTYFFFYNTNFSQNKTQMYTYKRETRTKQKIELNIKMIYFKIHFNIQIRYEQLIIITYNGSLLLYNNFITLKFVRRLCKVSFCLVQEFIKMFKFTVQMCSLHCKQHIEIHLHLCVQHIYYPLKHLLLARLY